MIKNNKKISFWQIFRLFFVVFALYIMGSSFYSWDGFKHYGSFADFLPGVPLMLILWSIVAVMLTILISLPFKVVELCFIRMRWKMGIEHILIFTGIFMLLSVLTWKGRFLIWHFTVVTMHIKLIVLLVIVIVSVLLSILSRHRAV